MKRLIAGAVVAGVAVFAGVGAFGDETTRNDDGTIVESGGLGAFVVRKGDCINLPGESLVQSVEGIPCWEPHDAEAYHVFDVTGGATYPGEDSIFMTAETSCLTMFHTFVGVAYEQSSLFVTWLAPSEESWTELDDREIVCMVASEYGDLEGSMRGSGR